MATTQIIKPVTVLSKLTTSETCTTVAETAIGSGTLVPNGVNVGDYITISGRGYFRTNGGSQTVEMTVLIDGTSVATTGAVTLQNISTAETFEYEVIARVTAVGASGGLLVSAKVVSVKETSGTVDWTGEITDSAADTVDFTSTNGVTVGVGFLWGAAHASNTLTVTHQMVTIC